MSTIASEFFSCRGSPLALVVDDRARNRYALGADADTAIRARQTDFPLLAAKGAILPDVRVGFAVHRLNHATAANVHAGPFGQALRFCPAETAERHPVIFGTPQTAAL